MVGIREVYMSSFAVKYSRKSRTSSPKLDFSAKKASFIKVLLRVEIQCITC